MNIVWHRADLRTHDHEALWQAAQIGPILPLFILDPNLIIAPYTGKPRLEFLFSNLKALDESYKKLNTSLVVLKGHPVEILAQICRESGAKKVFALRSYEPIGRQRDELAAKELKSIGIELKLYDGDCVFEPGSILKADGQLYYVFTPFWKNWSQKRLRKTFSKPKNLSSHNFTGLNFAEKNIDQAGEEFATNKLKVFINEFGENYETLRNLPAKNATSQLSPYFYLGILSPRLAVQEANHLTSWVRELCWRDFFRHLLWQNPDLEHKPFRSEWNDFPWRDDDNDLAAWRAGQTGYPLIDAGMRQLQQEGFIHNRVRMVVGSFLVKHLMISPFIGAKVFNELLIDGDLASNIGNWQWLAGCGVDAAPYFRVFNPILQSLKFDPNGEYIRRYVPELAHLNDKDIHQPNIKNYPRPIIGLDEGRKRFLAQTAACFNRPV